MQGRPFQLQSFSPDLLRAYRHRILLLALFGLWALVAWPPLERQFSALGQWRQRLAGRTIEERAAVLDYPAYLVAGQVRQATPAGACLLFLGYTGPEHVNYYKTRFDYYLYPRRILVHANSSASAEGCGYLAVFRDSPQNLQVEPFAGVWNEEQLGQRLAGLEKVHAGPHLELYRLRP